MYVGIDPGASGGLAFVWHTQVEAVRMPASDREVWEWVEGVACLGRNHGGVFAVIEQVQGYIGEGQPGSSAFKFGASYGALRMALVGAGIPFIAVTPAVWQRALKIPTRKREDSKTVHKNRLKARAQELYPMVKVTLATADALLMATHAISCYNRLLDQRP